MNDELGVELATEIGGGKARFFQCNVLATQSIKAAVQGSLAWIQETGMAVGGVIAAAGVSTPAKVCTLLSSTTRHRQLTLNRSSTATSNLSHLMILTL